ncbi:hypothetical protein DXZ75_10130 [Streptomyces sp. AcE210]|nr:hypothetical protein DXZ75_10130 [Streptomyces sp. AcE210]
MLWGYVLAGLNDPGISEGRSCRQIAGDLRRVIAQRNHAQSLVGLVQGGQISDIHVSLRGQLAFAAFPPPAHAVRQQS